MTHYTLCVPFTYNDDGTKRTSYPKVGAVFENHRQDTGEPYLFIKLDFPVGATEFIAFRPRSSKADEAD